MSRTIPKDPGIITLTCAYLPQITAKLQYYPHNCLSQLDAHISEYIQRRHQLRQPILDELDSQPTEI